MNPKCFKALKDLSKNPTELKNKLMGLLLLKKDGITVDEIITCCKNSDKQKQLIIPASCLTEIGDMYSQGKNNFKKDRNIAFKLYEYAADTLGNALAFSRCAQHYYDMCVNENDSTKMQQSLVKAEKYCNKAIKLAPADDKNNYLMGFIYQRKQKFSKAIEQLQLVEKEHEVGNDAQKTIKECFLSLLEKLYKNELDTEELEPNEEDEVTTSASSQTSDKDDSKEAKKPPLGWVSITEWLDGFDIKACGKLKIQLEVQLELLTLEMSFNQSSLDTVKKKLDIEKKKLEKNKNDEKTKALIKQLENKIKKLEGQSKTLKEHEENFRKSYHTYTDTENRILKRQYETEFRFFDPKRTENKHTFSVAKKLMGGRLATAAATTPLLNQIDTKTPVRRLITAERSTIEAPLFALKLHEDHTEQGYLKTNIFTKDPIYKHPPVHKSYPQHYGFEEIIKLGESEVKYRQRVNPHYNHLGDFYASTLETYAVIVDHLNNITGTKKDEVATVNEHLLAGFMLDFCKTGNPVTVQALKMINLNADEDMVHKLNHIFYHCFVKEITRWMLPGSADHELPLATAQARALQLISKGYLTIGEVFSQNAKYGVFTDKEIGKNIDKVRKKIILINTLYEKFIVEIRLNNAISFIDFFKKHPDGKTLPTRKELHEELRTTFGGEDDTDGEGYESDNEKEELLQSLMKPFV